MSEKIGVGLIGGGRTGTPLIEELLKKPYVVLKGVVDKNEDSPGMRLAEKQGIFTSDNPMDLAKMGDAIDILIEVSGDLKVKKQIKSYYEVIGNTKTIIVHDLVARLLMSIAAGSDELPETFHPDDVGIGEKVAATVEV